MAPDNGRNHAMKPCLKHKSPQEGVCKECYWALHRRYEALLHTLSEWENAFAEMGRESKALVVQYADAPEEWLQ